MRSRKDAGVGLLLALAIGVAWAHDQGFFAQQRFSDPISYWGDAFYSAAAVSAARRGDFFPFTSKMIPSLGAPFGANWNDFPATDDLVYWLVGLIARLTDTIVAVNIGYMLAFITAGLSMYFVARRFGFRREGAALAGFFYGMTHYLVVRTVHHYSLTFIGIMPWNVLVMCYLGSRRGLPFKSARFRIAAIATIFTGMSFVYYIFFAAQLYVLGTLAGALRHGRKMKWVPVLALSAIFAVSALSVSLDTIRYAWANGLNQAAVTRSPSDIELYALKPVSFMVPSHIHRWAFMRAIWAKERVQSLINGEEPAPYLGVLGCAFLAALALAATVVRIRGRGPAFITALSATTVWLVIAHVAGGLTGVLGLFNFYMFRSTNRVSVMVLTVVTLFGAWLVPWLLRRWPAKVRWAVCIALALASRYEQGDMVNPRESVANNRRQADSDRHLVEAMEAQLPPGAMIYQLPPMHFPEVPPSYAVDTYELFRPYFFAKTFRFSHGDVKGRPNGEWKFKVAALPAPEMIAQLKASGFAAILLNRKGYGDNGTALVNQLVAAGCRVVAQSDLLDNVAVALP